MAGPLQGVGIVEFSGLGPVPFACMMLADHGADIIRVCRPGGASGSKDFNDDPTRDVLLRSRPAIEIDLKSPRGRDTARDLISSADGVIEGFRPGVMERLGLAPSDLLADQPALVVGRMTGWGQTGPYAHLAGHDINYIALAGALHGIGHDGDRPLPPGNLLGDFGGGGMMLAFGMVSALLHAARTGQGQIIDCSVVEGTAVLTNAARGYLAQGLLRDKRGVNVLDSGSPIYDTYETSDGQYVAIGSLEPQFFEALGDALGLQTQLPRGGHMDSRNWPSLREELTRIFAQKTRDQWCQLLEQTDACFAPVLSLAETPLHPHNLERKTFAEVGGVMQALPAPRYSATATREPWMHDGRTRPGEILASAGYPDSLIDDLIALGVVA